MILKNRLKIILLVILLILIVSFPVSAELEVHFIDIGQGDSVLVRHNQDTNILIDGGNRWNAVEEKLLNYLTDLEIKELDAIISTHPHADHIGGLIPVIENFKVNQVYDSGRVHTSQTYEDYLKIITNKDIPYDTPRRGDILSIGKLDFEVVHPDDYTVDKLSLNNISLVLYMEYEEVSFLLTGDIESEAENHILDLDLLIEADILKVAHHGSKSSTHQDFLKRVNPEVGIITVGEDNPYNHPEEEVLSLLNDYEVNIYRTDLHGDIIISTDGFNYNVTSKYEIETSIDQKDLININTATEEELTSLWGVGPVTARNIIEYRSENCFFKEKQEIMNVDGINESKYNRWKDSITICN